MKGVGVWYRAQAGTGEMIQLPPGTVRGIRKLVLTARALHNEIANGLLLGLLTDPLLSAQHCLPGRAGWDHL